MKKSLVKRPVAKPISFFQEEKKKPLPPPLPFDNPSAPPPLPPVESTVDDFFASLDGPPSNANLAPADAETPPPLPPFGSTVDDFFASLGPDPSNAKIPPANANITRPAPPEEEEDEADPLDAFMSAVNKEAKAQKASTAARQAALNIQHRAAAKQATFLAKQVQSSSVQKGKTALEQAAEDLDIDPLEAFMSSVNDEAKAAKTQSQQKQKEYTTSKVAGIADDDGDPMESYLKARAMGGKSKLHSASVGLTGDLAGNGYDSDEEVRRVAEAVDKAHGRGEGEQQYDKEGRPINPKANPLTALVPIDHSTMTYAPVRKNFYTTHPDIENMPVEQYTTEVKALNIKVSGDNLVRVGFTFEHFGLGEKLMQCIAKQGFTEPTSIQKQAVPLILSGRDVIGIAQTGSGKTNAFVWPMVRHIADQPALGPADGPIGLVVAPTRELADQIYKETLKAAKPFKLKAVPVFGGMNMHQQITELGKGAHIVVATPGRWIDILIKNATNCARVTFLVVDEADRMFQMGFGKQVSAIVQQVRPGRQTLLFSATFPSHVQQLARRILTNPVRIVVGTMGAANVDVKQVVEVLKDDNEKWPWLLSKIDMFCFAGPVLIFVGTKNACAELQKNLKLNRPHIPVGAIHGDKLQHERMVALTDFKKGETRVLIATDVASRGLDIKGLKTVINYDTAKNIDAHVHRVGRTGRAGEDGVAFTLIVGQKAEEVKFAGFLVNNLDEAKQPVPPALLEIAYQHRGWQRKRIMTPQGNTGPGGSSKSNTNVFGPLDEAPGGGGGGVGGVRGRGGRAKDDFAEMMTSYNAVPAPENVNIKNEDYMMFKAASNPIGGLSAGKANTPADAAAMARALAAQISARAMGVPLPKDMERPAQLSGTPPKTADALAAARQAAANINAKHGGPEHTGGVHPDRTHLLSGGAAAGGMHPDRLRQIEGSTGRGGAPSGWSEEIPVDRDRALGAGSGPAGTAGRFGSRDHARDRFSRRGGSGGGGGHRDLDQPMDAGDWAVRPDAAGRQEEASKTAEKPGGWQLSGHVSGEKWGRPEQVVRPASAAVTQKPKADPAELARMVAAKMNAKYAVQASQMESGSFVQSGTNLGLTNVHDTHIGQEPLPPPQKRQRRFDT